MAVFTAAYIIEVIAGFAVGDRILRLELIFGQRFHPTQILTHIFLNGASGLNGFLQFLFHLLILWSFGSELERTWGSYKFLKFFFAGLGGSLLLSALIGTTLLKGGILFGFGGGLAAVLVAYAILWPNREVLFFFVIPMKMKWVVLIIFILMAVSGSEFRMIQFAGGALGGALYLYYYVRKGRLYSYQPPGGPNVKTPSLKERYDAYQKKKRLEKKQSEINRRIQMKEEVDRLLEKISREGKGVNSLSSKEKSFLDRASKEL